MLFSSGSFTAIIMTISVLLKAYSSKHQSRGQLLKQTEFSICVPPGFNILQCKYFYLCEPIIFYAVSLWDKNDNSPGIDILYGNFQKKIYGCSQRITPAIFSFSDKWRFFPKKNNLLPENYSTKSSVRIVTFSIIGWLEHPESSEKLASRKLKKFSDLLNIFVLSHTYSPFSRCAGNSISVWQHKYIILGITSHSDTPNLS